LLRRGTIVGKWHYRNFRPDGFLKQRPDEVVLTGYRHSVEKHRVLLIASVLMLGLLLFYAVNRKK
jgi:hypothetical protein